MEQIQTSLLTIHSFIRWLILSLALFGAARSFVSMLSVSGRFTRLDAGVSLAYAGVLDLQFLLGILLVLGALTLQETIPWIHPIVMIPAIIVAHLSRRFAAQPDRQRQQRQFAIYLGSLSLIVAGLAVIGQLALPR
jgi:uncharacterized membrane protein YphA (DoxX/SURF4 family)